MIKVVNRKFLGTSCEHRDQTASPHGHGERLTAPSGPKQTCCRIETEAPWHGQMGDVQILDFGWSFFCHIKSWGKSLPNTVITWEKISEPRGALPFFWNCFNDAEKNSVADLKARYAGLGNKSFHKFKHLAKKQRVSRKPKRCINMYTCENENMSIPPLSLQPCQCRFAHKDLQSTSLDSSFLWSKWARVLLPSNVQFAHLLRRPHQLLQPVQGLHES